MSYSGTLAINRIMKPDAPVKEFIKLAADSGCSAIELRNDLSDPSVLGDSSAEEVNASLKEHGVTVLTVNALQRFNDPALFKEKVEELRDIMEEAAAVHCPMIVLCPVNDAEDTRTAAEQHTDLVAALKNYEALFREFNMVGLVEPLGFEICSVRYKRQAVDAIRETGLGALYKLTHDTFHHYLSDEQEIFPEETGLIHTSGVLPGKEKAETTDEDRVFVTPEDCMSNVEQIKSMIDAGYRGPISYEPFSSVVQAKSIEQLKSELIESLKLILS